MEKKPHFDMVLKLNWKMLISYLVYTESFLFPFLDLGWKWIVISIVCRIQLFDRCVHENCLISIIKL